MFIEKLNKLGIMPSLFFMLFKTVF